jgi:hypothetical protein
MDNSTAFAKLDEHIQRVRDLPKAFEAAAPVVSDDLEAELKRQIAAAQSPTGQAWQPTRKGDRPLDGAEKSVGVAAVGRRIWMRAWGHIARHSKGIAKGGIVRQVIPTGDIPPRMSDVIRSRLKKVFAEHMGGQ